jgi:hypothetical protein
MTIVRLAEAKCPACGPRRFFITHWGDPRGDVRHEIPCLIDAEEMRGESHCACGEIILQALEPVDDVALEAE